MCWGWAKQWFANRRAVEEEVRCNSKLLSLGCHSGSGTTVQAQPWRWHDNVGSYWPCTAPRFRRSSLYHFLIFFYQLCHAVWRVMGGHEKGVQAAGRNQSAVTLWLQEGSTKCRDSFMMIAKGVLMFCWYVPYLSLYIGASFQGRSSRKGSKAAASRGPEVHVHIFVQNAKKSTLYWNHFHIFPSNFLYSTLYPIFFFFFNSLPQILVRCVYALMIFMDVGLAGIVSGTQGLPGLWQHCTSQM